MESNNFNSSNEKKLCLGSKVWELHIHSNQCFSVDKELRSLSIEAYVDRLLDLLNGYKDLEMISFTDHNAICFDLYREFYSRNSSITLLPGIEIDACLEKGGIGKHVIVYFDAVNDLPKLGLISSEINAFMAEGPYGSQKGEHPVYIHELLDKLVSIGVPFVISPHAMKQGKRSIDADMHELGEKERKNEAKKYIDQFFCFWESSGSQNIHKATEFLREMDCGERISVIEFSDSKDFDKLKEHLDNPRQYFSALPNFNGLKLAGSEISRIEREKKAIPPIELGNYIGEIRFDDQEIKLSPHLNTIIGGRGSGKSILLDSVANHLGIPDDRLTPERIDFINDFALSLKSMSGGELENGQFRFDYYNQSYIAKLFEKHGNAFNSELESYFSTAFERIEQLEVSSIRRSNEEAFEALLKAEVATTPENLEGFIEKYVVDNKDSLSIAIRDKDKKKVDSKLANFSYSATVTSLENAIRSKLPSFLKENAEVDAAINQLFRTICEQAFDRRIDYLEGDGLFNSVYQNFKDKKASISVAQKNRSEAMELFKSILDSKASDFRNRVAIVNSYLSICDGFQVHYENKGFADGETANAFLFKRELNIEHPIDYMIRMFSDNLASIRTVKSCNRENLWAYIEAFCFNEADYKQGCSADTLYAALSKFELRYNPLLSINYLRKDGTYTDISKMSPGTQTNILIEYIVHQDSKRPLLIDQPEDNVDNQTIYSKIKEWFMTLKESRQVIVVTHDANIVINADAENVILAKQNVGGQFAYEYGALEHGNILEDAFLILDGGKEAVRRRLVKYGD